GRRHQPLRTRPSLRLSALPPPPRPTPSPYTTLFRSRRHRGAPPPRRRHVPDRHDRRVGPVPRQPHDSGAARRAAAERPPAAVVRSEEHTSELQSRENLVCRLLLEKKKLPLRLGTNRP